MENLHKAFELAEHCFKGKLRKTGEPYVNHCYNVMHILKDSGLDDEDLLIAAMLHDVCEDTDLYTRKIQELFGNRVRLTITTLSRNQKPRPDTLKAGFKADETFKTFNEYLEYRLLIHVNRFYMGVLVEPYSLFIKMAVQIDNLATVEIFSNEKVARKIREVKKYFLPIYNKLYYENVLTPRYKKKYSLLKKHLVETLKKKEKALKEKLQFQIMYQELV